jgi:carboxyl-terminal processing protease
MSKGFKFGVVGLSAVFVTLLLVGALLGQSPSAPSTDPYRHINVFTEVFAKVKSDYVEEPDMKNVTLGAVNGLLVSLDPFASYLNAEQYKQYQKMLEQPKADVGLLLSRKYGFELGIVDAIEGSPADKAGLSTGDIIEAINGISTRDMPLAYADVLLHGDAGSSLELTVLRLRKPEPSKVTLKRAVVAMPKATSKMLDAETGYVWVPELTAGRGASVATLVAGVQKQGAKKLVLDLRHCAVGAPEEGMALANLFLEKGTIATLSGQKVPKKSFEADPDKTIFKGQLVVLTNRGTTGAAEIAAAALADNKRASVVGERSYGDAAVRKAVPTEDGGAVLLAVAKYYTPAGKSVQEAAVVPAFLVADLDAEPETDEDETPTADKKPETKEPPKSKEDAILKKALDVLAGKATQARNSVPAAAPMVPHADPRP